MLSSRHVRFATRYAAHRFRKIHPFEVQASLLNACNLRCAYCRCPDFKIDLMTTEQWVRAIEQFGAHGTMRIKFQGGEPTLRQDFCTLSEAAKAAGIRTAVVTNGLQLADKPELMTHLDEIVFSLDSPTPEHNDRMRGDGVHAAVCDAIELARARGRITLFINMVVTRHNLGQIDAMLDFCEARGIGLHVQPAVSGRRYYDETKEFRLSNDEIRAMHRHLADAKRKGRKLMFAASTYEKPVFWPDLDVLSTPSDGESSCMAGRFYVHVEPNGDVHPCAVYESPFEPKNIVRDGFEVAIENASHHGCGDCHCVYLNERKAVFGLKPTALWEMVRRG